jgi:hypothetical protein
MVSLHQTDAKIKSFVFDALSLKDGTQISFCFTILAIFLSILVEIFLDEATLSITK